MSEFSQQAVPVVMVGQTPQGPKNGLGVAGMVTGIIAVSTFWIPVFNFASPVLAILAIVFGSVGLSRVKTGAATNRGQAKAGLICGITYWVIIVGVFIIAIIAAANSTSPTY